MLLVVTLFLLIFVVDGGAVDDAVDVVVVVDVRGRGDAVVVVVVVVGGGGGGGFGDVGVDAVVGAIAIVTGSIGVERDSGTSALTSTPTPPIGGARSHDCRRRRPGI